MLGAFKDLPILQSPDGLRGGFFAAVEGRMHRLASESGGLDYELHVEPVTGHEVRDWACRQGRFKVGPETGTCEGAIRMLLAQPESGFRATIPEALMTSSVLDCLQLPASTFATFQLAGGTFSKHTVPEGSSVDDCERLGITFRSPQKSECTVGGLAVSHDFKTGLTTALHLGYVFHLDQYSDAHPPKALTRLISRFEQYRALWSHPFFLPTLLLAQHVLLVSNFVMDSLDRQVIRLEYCIGVTKAGRSNKPHLDFPDDRHRVEGQMLYVGEQLQRDNARRLTEEINDLTTKLEFTKWSPTWDHRFANFLSGILSSSTRLQSCRGTPASAFRETLEYVENYSQGLRDVVQSSHARMQLQLNILYTSIAQDDGQTNARLAASAGKDSTSMKIIALITAAYLPGTFTATLLSMDMFNWRFGQESDVSKDFWIYWAVAVPLTILTISGWALWWKIEERRFEQHVQKVVQQQQSSRSRQQTLLGGLKSHVVGIGDK